MSPHQLQSLVVLGAQFGDEGKGKIVDLLARYAHGVMRAQGGSNAGHTVLSEHQEYKLHLIPSGILHESCQCYIGGGVVVDPKILIEEIRSLQEKGIKVEGRLWISQYAHVIFPY